MGPKIYGGRDSVKIRTSSLLKKTHMPIALSIVEGALSRLAPVGLGRMAYSVCSAIKLYAIGYQPYAKCARLASGSFSAACKRPFFSNLLAGEKNGVLSTGVRVLMHYSITPVSSTRM